MCLFTDDVSELESIKKGEERTQQNQTADNQGFGSLQREAAYGVSSRRNK